MPRYTFQWNAVPQGTLDQIGHSLSLRQDDVVTELTRRYGARPKDGFVADLWPTLRDGWLASDPRARTHVVKQLRERHLGDAAADTSTQEGEDLYLHSVRNTSTLRDIVVRQFWLLGTPDHEGPPTVPAPSTMGLPTDSGGIGEAPVPATDEIDIASFMPAITPPRPWVDLARVPTPTDVDHGHDILDALQRDLVMDEKWVVRQGRRLEWWGGPVPISIEVSEPRTCLDDPTVKVSVVVTLIDDVTLDPYVVLDWIALRNMMTSVGALVWLPEERRVVASLTHYSYPGNDSLDRLLPAFLLLMYTEALALIDQSDLAAILGSGPTPRPHPRSGVRVDLDDLILSTDTVVIPQGAEPNAWIGDELAGIPEVMRQMGLFSTGDSSAVTAEFPFSSAFPAALRIALEHEPEGRTAMTEMMAMAHPGYGQGLLSLLHVPIASGTIPASEIANDMNVGELNGMTGFPAWGAWTVQGAENPLLTHARFIPNTYARPGLAATVLLYDYVRSQWAQERLVPADVVDAVRAGVR